MSIKTTATCDICGRVADMRAAETTGIAPPAATWLTVKHVIPGTAITLPRVPDDRNPDPDLCSWACVAAYAARQEDRQP